jgi:hypothetical protein
LDHAPDIVRAYHDRQQDIDPPPSRVSQRARRHLTRLGHIWLSRD